MRNEQYTLSRENPRAHLGRETGSDAPNNSEKGKTSWAEIPCLLRAGVNPLPAPWEDLFGPLRAGAVDDLVVVGQIGQSIDGRIATTTGRSHYINGSASLTHLHRLRAVVDAVVVGVGTLCADDPQLTVRHVEGPNPARVVIDPHGRSPPDARCFTPGARHLVVSSQGCVCNIREIEIGRASCRERV